MPSENEQKLRDYLKRVTADLADARDRLREVEEQASEPVAIVGAACRFPGGCRSPEDFWELVDSGTDAIGALPRGRGWDLDALAGHQGGFLPDAGEFDAGFFGISPREALAMDPQQRLLLETAWEAIERARIDAARLQGSQTGVFIGASPSGYGAAETAANEGAAEHLLTGGSGAVLSGRIAYTLGLEGPALTMDTACSSSLVSLHTAVQALRNRECTLALAGGVTVMALPVAFEEFDRQGGLAADGRCKAFADGADGTGWGEGAGVLLVERLSDALRAGRPVLAVVRGSAVNQDGASNGLTAPNGVAQQRVIRQALANAGLSASQIDAVEAHGTGTVLGDPIEAGALLSTYGRNRERPVWLGTVKSNIGHTQAAAGVAGVLKMALALRSAALPQTLHIGEPSAHIDWSAGRVELLREPRPWPQHEEPRRAAVSAFGVSGTNAHVILEEPPRPAPVAEVAEDDGGPGAMLPAVPWVLSGRTASGLAERARELIAHVTARPDLDSAAVARSLATTRSAFAHRAAVVGADNGELLAGLRALAEGAAAPQVVGPAVAKTGSGKLAMVFSGQGAQRAGMGERLYRDAPVFAAAIDDVCARFEPHLGRDLRTLMFAPPGGDEAGLLDRTEYTQPALFAFEVALFRLFESYGVRPDHLIGHSIGEVAAAHVAGVFGLPDACRLVAARGRLMQSVERSGAMVSIRATEADAAALLPSEGAIGIAAVNGPAAVVVSGDSDAVAETERRAHDRGYTTKRLRVSHAFHSAHLDPVLDDFREVAETVAYLEPRLPVVSNVTGEIGGETLCSPDYWVAQLRRAVRFADGVRRLSECGVGAYLELGPDATLTGAIAETLDDAAVNAGGTGGAEPAVIPALYADRPEAIGAATALARLYTAGADVDFDTVFAGAPTVDLPVYPFQREWFWLRAPEPAAGTGGVAGLDPGTGAGLWDALHSADAAQLARDLHADEEQQQALEGALPLVSQWLQDRRAHETVDRWRYHTTWQPVADRAAVLAGTWLVVAPAGADTALAGVESALRTAGATVRTRVVDAGTDGSGPSEDDGVRSGLSNDLFSGLSGESSGALSGVLSLLALGTGHLPENPSVPTGLALNTELARAHAATDPAAPLWLATCGATATGPSDPAPDPVQASTWGLGQVLGVENPDSWGGLVDLPAHLDERAGRRLAACLAAAAEGQVAIRPSGTLARRLVRAPRAASATGTADTTGTAAWPGGTVLITGGSGALGGHVARWLATNGAEHLLLVSRRGEAAPGAADLRAELTAAGAAVTFAACDTADRCALAAVIDGIPDRFPLTSVIHTAGALDDGVVASMTPDRLAAALRPKAETARNLHELTRDRDLSAFVLFSSLAATMGSAGQANYAAANAYLDALAQQRRAEGRAATAIAWGPWAGGGMAANDTVAERLSAAGTPAMPPGLACAALPMALADSAATVLVADIDWPRFAGPATGPKARAFLSTLPEAAPPPQTAAEQPGAEAAASRIADLPAAERLAALTGIVRTQAAAVLGHDHPDRVDDTQTFRENGFTSLAAVEFRNRINAATGLRLPATLVFDFPTPEELARHLQHRLTGGADTAPGTAAAADALPAASAAEDGGAIAIVGIGCRFPGGVAGPQDFWRVIADGVDAVAPFPLDRGWDAADTDSAADYAREGGFLADAAGFDAAFFGISPREALAMDPQQRLLLHTAWEAVEHAGIDPAALRGRRVGVFVGTNGQDYPALLARAEDDLGGHTGTGNAASVASGRIAYALGLQGPALTVDTACSASLVALHLAAEALRRGECTLALTGGATVMSTPSAFAEFARQGGLAADGRCKPFAAAADGTGWGEGVGVLAVERLADAHRNGHRVLAVVRGSAVNSDGASNGLTAPNGPAQQRVITDALRSGGLSPADVDVVEAHGTGTSLGDPIEAQALLDTYGRDRAAERPLLIGSVKSNIGHTQAAAGVAGVIKMVLAAGAGVAPRSLHVDTPTPHVDWSTGAVRVLADHRPWPDRGGVRRAGVSAFGVSGTNAHVILESPPPRPGAETGQPATDQPEHPAGVPDDPDAPAVWVLSGRSETALQEQAQRLLPVAEHLPTRDLALSLATTRTAFEQRAAVVGRDRAELLAGLRAVAGGGSGALRATARPGRTAFLFPGQGAQRPGMGLGLYRASGAFAAAMDEVCAHLDPHLDRALHDVLGTELVHRTEYTQPALFAVEVALFRLLERLGVHPDVLVGHSIGEITAAHVAGVLDLAGAAELVAARGRLMQALPGGGAMVSVRAAEAEVLPLLDGTAVELAAVNGPGSLVLSGPDEQVQELAERLSAAGHRTRELRVSHAFHSGLMEPMLADFERVLQRLDFAAPRIPIISNRTGAELGADQVCSPAYWAEQARRTVRFGDGLTRAAERGATRFVEAGPGGALSAMVHECLPAAEDTPAAVAVPALRGDDEAAALRTALATLHVHGAAPDWSAVFDTASTVALPTYPFQTQRYWPRLRPTARAGRGLGHRAAWTPVDGGAAAALEGRWLLLAPSEHPLAAAVAEGLAARGAEILHAPPPAGDATSGGPSGEHALAGVLCLPGTGTEHDPGSGGAVPQCLGDLTAVLRRLDDAGIAAPLWCLTQGAVTTRRADTPPDPAQASVWGLGRVAALERGPGWGGLVDLPGAVDDRALDDLAAALTGADDQVAIRAAGRFGRRITPADLPAGGFWHARGTALVTGGTGGLGGHVARWLAENGAEHVVLASRSGSAAPGAADLAAELGRLGTRVTIAECDVADRSAVSELVTGLVAAGDVIRSVFHTAGTVADTPLAELTGDGLAAALAAKAAGAAHLDALVDDDPLDAFVLFSSVAGTWGSGGQGAYAAANAYLDGLAERRSARGAAATSVAWGPWAQSGMATREGAAHRLERHGLRLLQPAAALDALGAALNSGLAAVAVADVDWARFVPTFTVSRPSPLLAGLAAAAESPAGPVPAAVGTGPGGSGPTPLHAELAALPGSRRRRRLLDLIRREAAAVLGHSGTGAVQADSEFNGLGFDSLTAVEFRAALVRETGADLPVGVVFDFPTPAALADHVAARMFGAEADADLPAAAAAPAEREPIAIVGMACRFPGGVDSPERLWDLVAEGTDAIGAFPADRGPDWQRVCDPDRAAAGTGTSHTGEGGFLYDAGEFDAPFFGMSPREALATDPQQRLILESAWEAVERAGIAPGSLRGTDTAVFVGAGASGYGAGATEVPEGAEGYLMTGGAGSVLSGRVAYTLGLEGSAVTVDTACSSSLVALHWACRELASGDASLALAGGVTVMATPGAFVEFSRQGGLAADGRCKPFAAAADGTGWSEGVGMLLVERLSDARRRGHPVLAVVRGSAVNQDGASNGLTAPNGPSQQRVIARALADAGVTAAEVDAVEAHGTGTSLGDPIEAQALLDAYGPGRPAERPLWLGSVKANIGHTQAAAGVAGVIKTVQAMRHGILPESLHIDEPSQHVAWGTVRLLDRPRDWPETAGPRRAGVSAFGVSGTNAHVIVESAPEPPDPEPESGPEPESAQTPVPASEPAERAPAPLITVVSGRSTGALRANAARLGAVLDTPQPPTAADLAWSAATTRNGFEHRAAVLADTREDVREGLRAIAEAAPHPRVVTGEADARTVAFAFSGQGAQQPGMGAQLYRTHPAFAAAFDDVCAAFADHLDRPLRDVIAQGGDTLQQTRYTQPALFAVETALYRLLYGWGLRPDFLCGHSIGELAAAHAAGVLDLADAAALVAARGRLMQRLPAGGAMTALQADPHEVEPLLGDRVDIAAVNGPRAVVVSGDGDAVRAVAEQVAGWGRKTQRLRVSHAFHSPLMEPVLAELGEVAAGLRFCAPQVPIISNTTGDVATTEQLCSPEYWVRHVRETVRFADGVRSLRREGADTFVEIGPDAVLAAMIGDITDDDPACGQVLVAPALRRDRDEHAALAHTVARLHTAGAPVDWAAVLAGSPARRVDLPTYAFQRKRYWLSSGTAPAGVGGTGGGDTRHQLLPTAVPLAGDGGAVLTNRLSLHTHPWLAGHAVSGRTIFPGAAFLELAVTAGDHVGAPLIEELVLENPLAIDGEVELQAAVSGPDSAGAHTLEIFSRPTATATAAWTRNASAVLRAAPRDPENPDQPDAPGYSLAQWPPAGARPLDTTGVYERFAERGLAYGAPFQGLRRVWQVGGELCAEVALPAEAEDTAGFGLHPALLDAALHTLEFSGNGGEQRQRKLPYAWNGAALHATGATELRVRLAPTGRPDSYRVHAADVRGEPVFSAESLVLRAAPEQTDPTDQLDQTAQPAQPAPGGGETAVPAARPARRRAAATAAPGTAPDLGERIAGRDTPEQEEILLNTVLDQVAAVLGFDGANEVPAKRAFTDLGITSLTAVELRNALNTATGLRLPATLVFDHPNPVVLARHLRAELAGESTAAAAPAPTEAQADDPIVIVGMACRYPGGINSPAQLWDLVSAETDAIAPLPSNRGWDLENLYDPDPDAPGKCYAREGGFLHSAGHFDPAFFGISPREAVAMDPQQRLLLETSWEGLEHAGIDPDTLHGTPTGVFAGVTYQDYSTALLASPDSSEGMLGTGNSPSVLSGRISYTLGLEGPAVTVDTACSSSLVALHWACHSLRRQDCSLALAGGVTVMATPGSLIEFSRQRALAADGRSKAFSADADGASWGEGAGMLVLERLSDARRLGHPVLAVIRGSAVNQDGASNGLTAPNGPAQQRVIRQALAGAGVSAAEVDAVEAHGTGTSLGDPIEAQALLATYGADRPGDDPLWLGSVKSNIGHSQAAAGVAGVIKMVEAMRHGRLPKTLHAEVPSPHVDWSAGAVRLLSESRPWERNGRPRRAGVSSFGMSGTNAHVLVEQPPDTAPEPERPQPEHKPRPHLLSARSHAALRAKAAQLRTAIDTTDPDDLAYSLATTRSHFEHRAVVIGADRQETQRGAQALAVGDPADEAVTGTADLNGKTVFVFPGQGAQWTGMAAELMAAEPVFADSIRACADALAPHIDWPLCDVLTGAGNVPDPDRADIVQPALFAVLVSLAELWRSYGVRPAAVLGHSQGEIAAACVAGALSLDDAARVVALRSKTLAALAGRGGMVSVSQNAGTVRDLLAGWDGRLALAAVNGPGTAVVSGDAAALDELIAHCDTAGVRTRRIPVDYASHSAHVEDIRAELADVLAGLAPAIGDVPFYSATDGRWLDTTELDGDYWYRNLRSTVHFEDATRALLAEGYDVFVELGGRPVLGMAIQETIDDSALDTEPAVIASLRRDDGSQRRFLHSLAEAYVRGARVDFAPALSGRAVELATYPFQETHYWPRPVPRPAVSARGGDAVSDKFWSLVEDTGDGELPEQLGISAQTPLGEALPALASWRRRQEERETVDGLRYRIRWQPVPEQHTRPQGTWLIAVPAALHEDPWATAAADALRSAGTAVETVPIDDAADRTTLAEHLGTRTFTGILSLLALDERPHPQQPDLPAGTVATLALVQALDDAAAPAPLWCATRQGMAATPSDGGAGIAAGLCWGFGRVVALENPGRWGGLVDLPAELDERAGARLAGVLARGDGEDQLCIRPAGVFARRLVRAAGTAETPQALRPTGTTLITGGTGALGAQIARRLAGAGAEHLLLLSRRGNDAAGAAELTAELTALGARVTVAACDAADRGSLARVLAEIPEDEPVRAVVHAAGTLNDGVVNALTPEQFAAVVRPKATAAWNLHELTGDLDAFVMFSSTAGVWGGPGQANYAAANAALDALAEHRAAAGLAATSIAWGPWDEEGMATDASVAERQRRGGISPLAPERAIDVLFQAVEAGETTLTVAGVDWPTYAPAFTTARPSRLLAELPEAAAAIDAAAANRPASDVSGRWQRITELPGAERERAVLDLVKEEAAAVLGYDGADAIEAKRAFSDLGFDSLSAIDFRNRLTTATGLRLPSTLIFDHPTAAALARHLRSYLGDEQQQPQSPPATTAGTPGTADEPVAIVGIACRFPGGVRSAEQLWDLVQTGTDAVGPLPTDRGWPLDDLVATGADTDNGAGTGAAGTTYAREGGFLSGVAEFDAEFFGITPREALAMDPQQRLVLECSWEALEHAGIDPTSVRGSDTGVYLGTNGQDYTSLLTGSDENTEGYLMTGNAASVLSGRVSYVLGMEGPAVSVDTACSSSLVALHWAVQALRRGECSLALAGGVTVMSTPGSFVEFARQGGLAPDGRCKAFAEGADGTGWSEGAGVLVVERVSDAERRGHPVLAVVRGSAINQDGASNGLTAPNGPSQRRVIARALADAGVSAAEVDAVEAHGTGTSLGDPIEAQALLATYGADRSPDAPLWLGSIKSNIGHTQAAAGVAGVIKMVEAMRHGRLPKTLHAEVPSPHVDWSAGAVEVLSEPRVWECNGRPRRAGVSSFGISGTNAHVVLEQGVESPVSAESAGAPCDGPVPLVVSARDGAGLAAQAAQLGEPGGPVAELPVVDV
ncbi:type I polyketide synthase, partial [Streptomonospora sediminis]